MKVSEMHIYRPPGRVQVELENAHNVRYLDDSHVDSFSEFAWLVTYGCLIHLCVTSNMPLTVSDISDKVEIIAFVTDHLQLTFSNYNKLFIKVKTFLGLEKIV